MDRAIQYITFQGSGVLGSSYKLDIARNVFFLRQADKQSGSGLTIYFLNEWSAAVSAQDAGKGLRLPQWQKTITCLMQSFYNMNKILLFWGPIVLDKQTFLRMLTVFMDDKYSLFLSGQFAENKNFLKNKKMENISGNLFTQI